MNTDQKTSTDRPIARFLDDHIGLVKGLDWAIGVLAVIAVVSYLIPGNHEVFRDVVVALIFTKTCIYCVWTLWRTCASRRGAHTD